jgi:predicted dehydrogenase
VRFGLVGAGNMGHVYAEALATQVPSGVLCAVTGGSRAAELAREYRVDHEASIEALLARTDIEIVILATPHSVHMPQTIAAAAASKHVYVEKPMGRTVAECDAMIGACGKAGVALTVAKQSRFNEASIEARRLLDSGAIGDIRMVRVLSSTVGWDVSPDGWITRPDEGGAYLDWGVHGCDAIRWFTGADAKRAYASFRNFGRISAPDPSAMIQYEMTKEIIAQVWMSYEFPEPGLGTNFQMMLVGSKGMLDIDRYALRLGGRAGWDTVLDLPPWSWSGQPKHPRRIRLSALQIEHFASAIRRGVPPEVTSSDARAAVEMVEAAQRSAATAQAVSIPLA